MARPCLACSSLNRDAIDVALAGPATFAAISERFGLSTDGLRRHKLNHLNPGVLAVARQRRTEGSAVSVYERLEELVVRANKLLDRAEKKGSLVAGAQILGQIRQALEVIGRLTGELDDKPVTNVVNIGTWGEWLSVRSVLYAALSQHPDAKADVIEALSRALPALEAGNG